MNQIFNIKRFVHFMGKELREQRKFLILSTCAIFGITAIFSALIFSDYNWDTITPQNYKQALHDIEESYLVFYLIGLSVVGVILASLSFTNIHKKAKGSYYFMQPVSMFEKFFSKILLNVFLFSVIYTLLFFFVKIFSDAYIISNLPCKPSNISIFSDSEKVIMQMLSIFICIFTLHAMYLAGSVTFKKFNFLICTILVGVFFIIAAYYLGALTHFIAPETERGLWIFKEIFVYRNVAEGANDLVYYATTIEKSLFPKIIRLLEYSIFCPLLYLYAWLRFKEKQV